MRILGLLVVTAVLNAPAVFACSCVNTGSYCSTFHGTKIVFVGHVTEDSGEGWGKGPAKMVVDEVLHGLPRDVRELTVDTGAGTSCYMRLTKGERYVIYGSPIAGATGRISRDWCSFSFLVAGNETLLAALEQEENKGAANLLGRVQIMHQEFNVSGEGAAAVRVTAVNGTTRLETLTNSDGEFQFSDVAPGTYHLSVVSPDLFEDKFRFPEKDPSVEPSGCGYQNLYVWTNGRVQGTVRDIAGKAIEGVTVQAFVKDARNELSAMPLRQAKTDAQGQYEIPGLPPGQVVIGVNGEKYADRSRWPPTFYPGTGDRDTATPILLDRGEKRSGVDLRLPEARQQAVLHFEAVFEDGSPAAGTSASVESVAGIQRVLGKGKDTTNMLDVPVYQGETYIVHANKVSVNTRGEPEEGKPFRMQVTTWKGLSAPIQVEGPEVHVRVVMRVERQLGK